MANEAILWFETEIPIPFTVANATGVEKGAYMQLSDPMTAAICSGDADLFAGIASKEKIASDGNTKLGLFRGGYFKGTASGNIAVGDPLAVDGSDGQNLLYSVLLTESISGCRVIGTSMETATTLQTFIFELKPYPRIDSRV